MDNHVSDTLELVRALLNPDSNLTIVFGDSERKQNILGLKDITEHISKSFFLHTSKDIPLITSIGSITFPKDLLIFLPCASLTIACKYTSL